MKDTEPKRDPFRNMPVGVYGKFAITIDSERYTWLIQTLVEIVHTLPIKKMKLDDLGLDLDENVWFHSGKEPTTRHMIEHYRRIEQTDLGYPIILAKERGLMDGYHRLVKAYIYGHKTISTVCIEKLPRPDSKRKHHHPINQR